MPWTPEGRDLPTATDLRQSIDILTIQPADQKHMAWCLAKLQIAFESHLPRPSADVAKLRMAVWSEANADLGDDLWSEATMHCLRNAKYGMPKPPDFRRAVIDKFTAGQRKLDRCRRMMELHGERYEDGKRAANQPFQREPKEVRLRTLTASLRKVGRHHDAAKYERELAGLENREPDSWVDDYIGERSAGFVKAPDPKLPPVSPANQAALKRSVAKEHRKRGNVSYAEMLEREADALAPEHVEEPMGDEHEAAA